MALQYNLIIVIQQLLMVLTYNLQTFKALSQAPTHVSHFKTVDTWGGGEGVMNRLNQCHIYRY